MKVSREPELSYIDLNDDECVHIHVGGHVIYIDNTTNEMIVDMWEDGSDDDSVKHLHP
jgi:hypothetical protein